MLAISLFPLLDLLFARSNLSSLPVGFSVKVNGHPMPAERTLLTWLSFARRRNLRYISDSQWRRIFWAASQEKLIYTPKSRLIRQCLQKPMVESSTPWWKEGWPSYGPGSRKALLVTGKSCGRYCRVQFGRIGNAPLGRLRKPNIGDQCLDFSVSQSISGSILVSHASWSSTGISTEPALPFDLSSVALSPKI